MVPRSMQTALQWLEEGRRVVACTLVETLGSAPLDPGAEMLVDDTGRIEGSVTGGCVEGALYEEAQSVLDGAQAGTKIAITADAVEGSFGAGDLLDDNVARDARGFLDEGRSAVRRYSAKGETMGEDLRVAIRAFATAPRMVIFGAIDFSAALAAAA